VINPEHYTYRIMWSEEDQEYVGLCAEFPSLSNLDSKPINAMQGIMKLVADVVEDMLQQGETLPLPLADKQFSGKFQVRIPPQQHRRIAIEAMEQGVSLNRYVSAKLNA
jgi:predicted HicB family RNase H-like nuclease